MAEQRVQKVLADQGICSRREAERLIAAGKVKVNGHPVGLGDKMDPDYDKVSIDGKTVRIVRKRQYTYIMLHKPRGFLTTRADDRGRKTVMAVCYQLHAQRILALSYGVVPILRNQELSDRYHFLVDALEFLDQYRKLDDGDLMAIVGGSFGPDGGASYVEIANVQNIRKRNEEIVAQHNC